MWFASKEEQVKRLHAEGFELLERGDHAGAEAKARALLDLGWSGGFELLALVQRERGEREAAVRTLEEAAKVAPLWTLAQLRGNVLDELGRKDDAVNAYDEALALPGVWAGSVRYNRAVALAALGRWGDALADAENALEDARDAPFVLPALRLAIDALAALGRHEDAIALVNHVGGMDEHAAALTADLRACALARAGHREAAREAAELAVESGTAGIESARVLASGAPSGPRQRVRIVVRGPSDAPGIGGFFRLGLVRAEDEREALALMARLEPSAVRTAILIERFDPEGPEAGPPAVLHLAARIHFDG
jgi:predicted negative regulator of RcsB-dependent stress response